MAAQYNVELILEAQNKASGQIKQLQSDIWKLQKNTNTASTNMNKWLQSIWTTLNWLRNTAIVTAAAFTFKKVIDEFATFEKSMSDVKAITWTAWQDFQNLSNLAKQMWRETVFTATEAAQWMKYLWMAWFDTEQIMKSLWWTLDLASASWLDLWRAADIATNVLTWFWLSANETNRVVDVMAKTVTSSNTNMEELWEAMKYIAPLASTLWISLEETSAAIWIFANAWLKGWIATRTLNAAFARLADPTDEVSTAMQRAWVQAFNTQWEFIWLTWLIWQLEVWMAWMTEQQKLATLNQIFWAEAFKNMNVLMSAWSEELERYTKELQNSEWAAKAMAKTQINNLRWSFKLLQSAISWVMIDLWGSFSPQLKSRVDALRKFFYDNWNTIVEVLSQVGNVFWEIFYYFWEIITSFFTLFTWDINSNKSDLETWLSVFTTVAQWFALWLKFIMSVFQSLWNFAWIVILKIVKIFEASWKSIWDWWNILKTVVIWTFQTIWRAWELAWEVLVEVFLWSVKAIQKLFETLADNIWAAMRKAWNLAISSINVLIDTINNIPWVDIDRLLPLWDANFKAFDLWIWETLRNIWKRFDNFWNDVSDNFWEISTSYDNIISNFEQSNEEFEQSAEPFAKDIWDIWNKYANDVIESNKRIKSSMNKTNNETKNTSNDLKWFLDKLKSSLDWVKDSATPAWWATQDFSEKSWWASWKVKDLTKDIEKLNDELYKMSKPETEVFKYYQDEWKKAISEVGKQFNSSQKDIDNYKKKLQSIKDDWDTFKKQGTEALEKVNYELSQVWVTAEKDIAERYTNIIDEIWKKTTELNDLQSKLTEKDLENQDKIKEIKEEIIKLTDEQKSLQWWTTEKIKEATKELDILLQKQKEMTSKTKESTRLSIEEQIRKKKEEIAKLDEQTWTKVDDKITNLNKELKQLEWNSYESERIVELQNEINKLEEEKKLAVDNTSESVRKQMQDYKALNETQKILLEANKEQATLLEKQQILQAQANQSWLNDVKLRVEKEDWIYKAYLTDKEWNEQEIQDRENVLLAQQILAKQLQYKTDVQNLITSLQLKYEEQENYINDTKELYDEFNNYLDEKTRDTAQKMIAEFNLVTNSLETLIATQQKAWFWEWLAPDEMTNWVNNYKVIDEMANWWNVYWNNPYIVWERWPELFVPKTNWNIISNEKLWQNVSININMWWVQVREEWDINKIADALARKIQLSRNFNIS